MDEKSTSIQLWEERIHALMSLAGDNSKGIHRVFHAIKRDRYSPQKAGLSFLIAPEGKTILHISLLRFFYENYRKNILFAWESIRLSQQYDLPLPQWAITLIIDPKTTTAITKLVIHNSQLHCPTLAKALDINGHKITELNNTLLFISAYEEIIQKHKKGVSLHSLFITASEKFKRRDITSFSAFEKRYYTIGKKLKSGTLPSPFDP